MEYAFMLLAAGFGLAAATWFVSEWPGRRLRSRFDALGRLRGRTTDDIIAVVGPPDSYSFSGDGRTLCRWRAGGYDVALEFDGYVCDGVTGPKAA